MIFLKESFYQPTVGYIKNILQNALMELEEYDDGERVKVESNTYYIKGNNFLGLTSVGYIDLDNIIEEAYGDEDFIEKVSNWYDMSENTSAVDTILNKYADVNDPDELVSDILIKMSEEDLDKISRITSIKR